MRQHPVTPMTESDLRLHLAKQSAMRMGLVDLIAFHRKAEEQLRVKVAAGAEAVVFDGFEDSMLDETARMVWELAQKKSMFAVGSSGLTHGLRIGVAWG